MKKRYLIKSNGSDLYIFEYPKHVFCLIEEPYEGKENILLTAYGESGLNQCHDRMNEIENGRKYWEYI